MFRESRIGIVSLGIGNVTSVANAIHELGYEYCLVTASGPWDDLTHLVLPGVGHFRAAMMIGTAGNWLNSISEFAKGGRPVLGICLGMQLLATAGTEGGECQGLGLIPGMVTRMRASVNCPIPHVGWNTVHVSGDHPILEGLKPNRDFYFVHSYEFLVDDPANRLAVTYYPSEITAVVGKGSVVGFQFHPEKSQASGLRLLENFCEWDGTC